MSHRPVDPRCPECGEPIGQRATFCMHCSADLTDERAVADDDADGQWDGASTTATGQPNAPGDEDGTIDDESVYFEDSDPSSPRSPTPSAPGEEGQLLDPDGFVDNSLTVVVGILGGIVVGAVGLFLVLVFTGSGWGFLLGLIAWLGSTAHLVRRRTVQGALSRSAYGVAIVLLLFPLVAFSPVVTVDGGLGARGASFVALLVFVAIPAGIAAFVGWVASRYVPEDVATGTR